MGAWRIVERAALVVGCLLLAAVAVAGMLTSYGLPVTGRVADRQARVVLSVGWDWSVTTRDDAGTMSTRGDSGGDRDPYYVSDMELRNGEASIAVDILPVDARRALAKTHRAAVKGKCRWASCSNQQESPRPTTVDGRPALAQRVNVVGEWLMVVTTRTSAHTVVLTARTGLGANDHGGELSRILTSARLLR